ncbi:hypothetical protein GBA52_007547 [Prunus armeniaca]|nr:hypothetical protein GBA52_007547 [Prunus armeniaca]
MTRFPGVTRCRFNTTPPRLDFMPLGTSSPPNHFAPRGELYDKLQRERTYNGTINRVRDSSYTTDHRMSLETRQVPHVKLAD